MHESVLSDQQKKLLSLIRKFSPEFGLVGGTAIALQIGHRKSIDFDLAKTGEIKNDTIADTIRQFTPIEHTLIDEPNELTVVANSVKLTFFKYPFKIKFQKQFKQYISMPDLLTLGSMKAYALGRRAKWKDYVDLFFILKKYSLSDLVKNTKNIFKNEFNEKFFREQLSYFKDIDYSEQIDYVQGYKVENNLIKNNLTHLSLQKTL